jgi:hypothetical protein
MTENLVTAALSHETGAVHDEQTIAAISTNSQKKQFRKIIVSSGTVFAQNERIWQKKSIEFTN